MTNLKLTRLEANWLLNTLAGIRDENSDTSPASQGGHHRFMAERIGELLEQAVKRGAAQ